jgi:MFS family permease
VAAVEGEFAGEAVAAYDEDGVSVADAVADVWRLVGQDVDPRPVVVPVALEAVPGAHAHPRLWGQPLGQGGGGEAAGGGGHGVVSSHGNRADLAHGTSNVHARRALRGSHELTASIILKPLHIATFRAVFTALAVSMIGDSMMLAIPAILVRTGSGSNTAAGFVIFFFTVPICPAPMAGPFTDRFMRRPFLAVVNGISALALAPLLAITTPGYWWTGYVVAAFLGCSYVSTSAGVSGLLAQIVPADMLGEANGLLQSFRQGLRLIGPLSGVLLYERLVIAAVTGADAASFAIAATIFACLKVQERTPQPRLRRVAADLTLGAKFLYKNSDLRTVTISIILFSAAAGAMGAATYAIVTNGLAKPPEFIGTLTSVMGIGAITGGLLSAGSSAGQENSRQWESESSPTASPWRD